MRWGGERRGAWGGRGSGEEWRRRRTGVEESAGTPLEEAAVDLPRKKGAGE